MSKVSEISEITVSKADLISQIQELYLSKARFVTATCLDRGDEWEIIYHFELPPASSGGEGAAAGPGARHGTSGSAVAGESQLVNVSVRIGKGESLPSITSIYFCALLIENEIKDLFGVNVTGIAVDFGQKMLRTEDSPGTVLTKGEVQPLERVVARCQEACPAGVDVPRYVRLISQRRFEEALEVVREQNPLAAICGRVCFAPCEEACRQYTQGKPVSIRLLKRLAADKVGFPKDGRTKRPPWNGKRVAVVGSGPAGLTAAYYLARKGYYVTVFESLPKAGGMLRTGIPDYRLPQEILDAEIGMIEELGVAIKTGVRVESLDELREEFDAVLVAVGAHKNVPLGIEGEEDPRVLDCVRFLRDVNLGNPVEIGNRVLVLGGGNSAIDAARTSIRLGASDVRILYRRTRKEMPASEHEVEAALEEGVQIEFLVAPNRIVKHNGQIAIELTRMKLGAPDASGRARPEPIPGSEFEIEGDAIIAAIGQRPEVPAGFGLKVGRGDVIDVDKETMATNLKGVFAAGDAVLGAASVVEAVGTAKKAASSIDLYLGGDGVVTVRRSRDEFVPRGLVDKRATDPKVKCPMLPVESRLSGFPEVELGLPEHGGVDEASRCWRCDWNE